MAKIYLFKILTISIFFTMLGSSIAVAENIIYVDDNVSGANNGSSWENAFNYLQDALAIASDGDEIRVAQGIYTPDSNSAIPDGTGDQEATFQLRSNISLIGGYAGYGESDPNTRDINLYETILSGDLHGNDVDVSNIESLYEDPSRAENSFHVVISQGHPVIDGFTIAGGNANERTGGRSVSSIPGNNGGGIYNPEGQLSLVNCTLARNNAYVNGGGIYNGDGELDLANCTFTGNYAWGSGGNGGGIYNSSGEINLLNCNFTGNYAWDTGGGICGDRLILTNCTFVENHARDGGVLSTGSEPTIDNCMFIKNSASSHGGGIYYQGDTDRIIFGNMLLSSYSRTPNYPHEPGITNCTFIENTACYGGGMYNDSSSPIITNCIFIRNATNLRGVTGGAGNRGGGMYNLNSSPTLISCAFIDNWAAQDGGGIYNNGRSSSDLIVMSSVFTGNRAGLDGGAAYIYWSNAFLINCTLAQNSAENGASVMCESFGWEYQNVEIINCILWDGNDAIWKDNDSVVNVSYSNVRGGWEGLDNIDEDPLFVDQLGPDHIPGTEDDDLRLAPVSPCVDTGDPDYTAGPNETDLDGNPRIISGRLDMGAYEFQGNVYVDDDAPNIIGQRRELEIDYLEGDGSKNRPYETIQEAIDIAKDGYTVLVQSGVYDKIDYKGKAITVAGTEGAAVIGEAWSPSRSGSSKEDAVTFHTGEGRNSMLKNFIITNSSTAISLNFSSPQIYNVTIVGNDFGIAAYENSHPDIRNCILWDNTDGDLFQCEAKYSCIETGTTGEGSINVNPLFVDAVNGDYHLKSEGWRWNAIGQSWTWDDVTSLCIDAGDPCMPLGNELMSVPRDPNNLYGGANLRINMGAYGGTCQASIPPLNWPPELLDPAQWALDGAPREVQIGTGIMDYWIEMKAQPASDASGFVEYFFECTTESGFSSGWQSSNEYTVQVGRSGQGLRFRVKARDLYGNETAWSDERTAH